MGNIINISPDDESFAATTIPLQVVTSRNAFCEYKFNDSYTTLTSIDSRVHTETLSSLIEGEYVIPVRCRIGDHVAEAQITFGVDFTSPVINRVNDGNYTCGNEFMNVYVEANESRMGSYEYELYDQGASSFGSGSLVLSATTGPDLPIKIPTENLTENNKYTVRVRATDAAGNVGRSYERSDGVLVVSSNHSACQGDAAGPQITFSIDDSRCSSVSVQMICDDAVGCGDIQYGTHVTSSLCTENQAYTGQRIELDKTSWICYTAEDALGQNITGQRKVVFTDDDGDGITNSCDICSNTGAGKVVGINGCADGQGSGPRDTDGDSLPDDWEETYNAPNCALDSLAIDSDGNLIDDNLEDYDDDGRSNFKEFLDNTHPCISDTPLGGPSRDDGESNLVAWIFLIVGLLLVIGGIGYLIYYYKSGPKTERLTPARISTIRAQPKAATSTVSAWKQKLSQIRKTHVKKSKSRERRQVFGTFGTTSKEIPHLEKSLKGTPTQPKIKKVAQQYVKHKKKIEPGLRKEEKSVFAKLEKIGKKSKTKDIKEVVSKGEAKDVFNKLKKISKKRKK
mgnify:CR=1 FL=1